MSTCQELPINFRQIDGTKIYRSSRPCGGTLGAKYCSLGIKTVIDFRDPSEIRGQSGLADHYDCFTMDKNQTDPVMDTIIGNVHQSEEKRRHVLLPLIPRDHFYALSSWPVKLRWNMASVSDYIFGTNYVHGMITGTMAVHGDLCLNFVYRSIIDHSGPQICKGLKLMSEASRVPAVICCSMGKDRTGIMSALIQHICGWHEDRIAHDYALSGENYACDPNNQLLKEVKHAGLPASFQHAPLCEMIELLAYIKSKYASLDLYLDSIGFTKEDRESLKQNITM